MSIIQNIAKSPVIINNTDKKGRVEIDNIDEIISSLINIKSFWREEDIFRINVNNWNGTQLHLNFESYLNVLFAFENGSGFIYPIKPNYSERALFVFSGNYFFPYTTKFEFIFCGIVSQNDITYLKNICFKNITNKDMYITFGQVSGTNWARKSDVLIVDGQIVPEWSGILLEKDSSITLIKIDNVNSYIIV